MITLTAQNTATGDEIVSEQAQASDKENVLDALGKAAAAIRGKLGEDLGVSRNWIPPLGRRRPRLGGVSCLRAGR